MAAQSWYRADGRARAGTARVFLGSAGKAPPRAPTGPHEPPGQEPAVPARILVRGPCSAPALCPAVAPAGADPRTGRGTAATRAPSIARCATTRDPGVPPQGPPGCPLSECHHSRGDTQTLQVWPSPLWGVTELLPSPQPMAQLLLLSAASTGQRGRARAPRGSDLAVPRPHSFWDITPGAGSV